MDFIATFLLALLLQANVTNSNVGLETNPNTKIEACVSSDDYKTVKYAMCINGNNDQNVLPFLSMVAPSITATKSDLLVGTDNGPMGPSPGDVIEYTIVISNASGAMDATGVIFTDMIDANTTLVPGSLKTSVVAVNDAYSTVGNVSISVPTVSGLLINDINLDGDVLNVTGINTAGTQGNVTFAADGSFTFNPNPGYEGTTTFTYTVSDGTFTSVGTVSITVAGMIWFINASAPAGGDGRLSNPWNSMNTFNVTSLDGTGDNIFVYSGTYTNTTSTLLLGNQRLIGQGAVGTLATLAGVTFSGFPPISPATIPTVGGTNPIFNQSGNAVNAQSQNRIYGLTINNTSGTALTSNVSSSLLIRDVVVTNTGGIAVNFNSVALDVIFRSVSASNGSYGMRVSNTTGSLEITGTSTTDGTGGVFNNIGSRGIELVNATNITLRNLTMTNANTIETGFDGICDYDDNLLCNAAIYMNNVSTAVLNNVDISTTNEHGINGNVVSNLTLTNCTSTGNGDSEEENALKFRNLTGTCSFSGCTFSNAYYRNSHIINTTGSLTLTINNCNFENTSYVVTRQDCFEMRTQSNATATVTITNSSFARAGSKGVQALAEDNSNFVFNFTSNTIRNFGNPMAGIEVGSNGANANMNYNINNNTEISSQGEVAVLASTFITSDLNGRVNDNGSILHNSPTATTFANIRNLHEGNGQAIIEIKNNPNVTSSNIDIPVDAIAINGNNATARLDLTLQNNSITNSTTTVAGREGIVLRAGTSTMGTAINTLCGNVSNNTLILPVGYTLAYRVRFLDPSSFMQFQGAGPTISANWTGNGNTNTNGAIAFGPTTTFTFGATCTVPSHPFASGITEDALTTDDQDLGQELYAEIAEQDKEAQSNAITQTDVITNVLNETEPPVAMSMMSGETVTVGGMSGFLLPQDRNMTISFQVSIDNPFPLSDCSISNQGTITGSNFSSVLTDDPDMAGAANPTVTTLNIAPNITVCPPNLMVNPTDASCGSLQTFSATAVGCPTPTIEYRIGATVITSPYTFPTGTTTVDVTASNGVMPNATCSFTVTVAPPPTAFNVTGGGTRCDVDPGFVINLSDTETGVNYQLFNGMTSVGSPIAGTGMAIDFPAQSAAGTYTVVGVGPGGCSTTMLGSAVINISITPISDAGMAQTICATSTATLAATATNGTGQWSIVSGPSLSLAQFSSTTSGSAIFTPTGGAGLYTLRWTVSNSPCVDATDDVVITVNPVPTADAGTPQTICENGTATLNATFTNGVGIWSVFSGPSTSGTQFANSSDPTTTFTPSGGMGTYTLRWTVTSLGCPDAIDDVVITVNGQPSGDAGMNQAICGNASAMLSATFANGTPSWSVLSGPSLLSSQFSSTSSPTATFTPAGGAGTYILRWTVANAPCTAFTDDVEIIASTPPTGNAGDDQSICSDQTATLNASFANGTGLWNVVSGPSVSSMQFSNVNAPNAVFTPAGGGGTYILRWTVSAPGCTDVVDEVEISVLTSTTAIATPSAQTICTGDAITEIVLSSPVTGTTFTWTRDNTMSVTGIAASGTTDISGTLVNTTNSAVTVTFTISPSAGTCTGPDVTATVVVNPIPNVVATPSTQTICSGDALTTIALNGNVSGTVYNWTRDNTASVTGISASGSGDISGTLTNITNAPITVTFTIVPSYTNAGETCTGIPITATVVVNPIPNAVATPSTQTICTGDAITTIALTGNVVGTVFNWTRDNTVGVTGIAASGSGDISGILTNTTNAAITVTFTITPSYTNAGEECVGTPMSATVVVNPIPNAVATPSAQTICTGDAITTIALTGNVVGTVYNWTRDNTVGVTGIAASGSGDISGSLTNTTNAAVTVTFTITPSYTNAGGTCTGAPITATAVVNPIPNAVATPSAQTICTGDAITTIALTGNVVGTVYNWTRDNTVGVTGIAPSGSGDISGSLTNTTNAAITVTFTITPSYTNASGTCTGTPITASVVVNPIPNAVATPSAQTICTGDNITTIVLTGNVVGTVYNWTRDNTVGVTGIAASGSGDISGSLINTTNAAITVTFTITPSYTNAGGTCTGTPITATVVVNPIPNSVATPSAQTICTGNAITTIALTGNVVGTVYNWTRDNTASVTGIAASGSGDISGTLTNTTNAAITVTFTITPTYTNTGGTCTGTPITATVVVNPIPNAVATPSAQTICTGDAITTIALTGNVVGTVYNWTRDNAASVTGIAESGSGDISGSLTNTTNAAITVTFTITPSYTNAGGTCTGTPITATVVVNPIPNAVATPSEQTICSEDDITTVVLTGDVVGTVYNWTRDNTVDVTGIAASGSGDISGTLTNITDMPITVTFTITPSFTNAGEECIGMPITATVVVNPTATVDQVDNQVLCNGATSEAVTFTSSSTNGDIIYNWTNNEPSIGLAASGIGNILSFTTINTGNLPVVATITVIPEFSNGGVQCDGVPMIFTITVNPPPVMDMVSNVVVCNDALTPIIDFTTPLSGGSIVYDWTNDNTSIGLGASGTGDILPFTAINTSNAPVVANLTVIMSYTNDGITCVSLPMNFTITVNPTPIVNTVQNQVVCNNLSTTLVEFVSPTTGGTITYNWTNNTPSIGLAAMGTGNIAAFTAINTSTTPIIATITVTPSITNGGITCTGNPITFTITVNPSPTVFTVSGGGTKCTTDDGLAITLSGSQTGVNYQLQLNGGNVGAPVAGTGAALNFPVQSTAGTYTVVATNATTGCTSNMTGNAVILVVNCDVSITDPCVCLNNATTPTNGQFSEMITVMAPAGQTWTVSAVSGLFTTTSPAPPAAPIAITVGTVLTASGGTYTLNGRHIDALGYTISVTNNRGTTLTISNSCSYPSPIISSPPAAVCLGTPYPLTGVPGDANIVSESFTVNGVAATTFNPTATGTYTIVYTVNGGIPKEFGPNDPGCIQSITQLVEVNPIPVITVQPVDTGVCDDGTAIFTVAATVTAPSTVSYQWQRQINGIWTNINGATTTTLTINNVTDADNNSRFRVIVSSENTNGVSCPVFSNVAWLYVHTSVSMTCNGHINFSLDENCGAENFANIFLSGPNSSFFYDVIFKLGNTVIPTSQVKNYIGRVLTYEVIDICDGNRCWGTVTFEDKLPPILNCPCSAPPANVSTMTEIARTGSKIYYRSNGTYSWQAAYAHAQSIGGQMVSINNAQENALIKAGMDANYPAGWRVWIGLTDDEAYGGSEANSNPTVGWVWTNGDPLTYTNWSAGEPNGINAGEDYVEMFASGMWNDNTNTSFIQGYILEVENCTFTCAEINSVFNSTLLTQNPNLATADACGPVTSTFVDQIIGDECDGQQIIRSWYVEDQSGNTATCQQFFNFRALTTDDVTFATAEVILNCNDGTTPAEIAAVLGASAAYPTVIVGGIPTALNSHVCNIYAAYTDTEIDACAPHCHGNKKVIRRWTILDWCSGELSEAIQIIKAVDQTPPTFITKDTTVSTRPWDCTGEFFLPLPWELHDNCDANPTYVVSGPEGVVVTKVGNRWRASNVEKGIHTFTYTASDCCGNKGTETVTVTVLDKTPPIAIAKQDIVISLVPGYEVDGSLNGQAKMFPGSVDNGSFDNCSDVKLEIRRPDGAPACGNDGNITNPATGARHNNNVTFSNSPLPGFNNNINDTDGGEFVKFCCADIPAGETFGIVEVELRVWDDGNMNGIIGDAGDNYNVTWANVRVEYKVPPQITCPPDMTIYCDWAIDDNPGTSDASAKSIEGFDFTKTGLPTAVSVCGTSDIRFWDRVQVNQCKIGTITRTFLVGTSGVKCVQTIKVDPSLASQPWTFIPSSLSETPIAIQSCDGPTAAQIQANAPRYTSGPCDNIGVSTDVKQFDFEQGVCRKWRVEFIYDNWCTDEKRGPFYKYFVYNDVVAPELTCQDTMFAVDNDCVAQVVLSKTAIDTSGCIQTGWLKWEVYVDLWADGTNDYLFTSFYAGADGAVRIIDGDAVRQYKLSGPTTNAGSDGATQSGQELRITLPDLIEGSMSNHKVVWKVTDGCHNYTSCHESFMVVDKKKPTPVCVPLSTALMADPDGNGPFLPMVELWAVDFMNKAYDNCTEDDKLLYTFDNVAPQVENKTVFGRVINIDVPHYFNAASGGVSAYPAISASEIAIRNQYLRGENGLQLWLPESRSSAKVWTSTSLDPTEEYTTVDVMVTVWDKKFNWDFCWTFLKLGLHTGANTGSIVSGNISTESGQGVKDVQVVALASLPEYPLTVMTDAQGNYEMDLKANTQLTAVKDVNYSNGVSTLDLVLIQRHILGIQSLDSPYKLIAADANNDGQVTAGDLIELRKLILGLTDDLPNNTSWRFPIASQVMDPNAPFPYDEDIMCAYTPNTDMTNQNFIAVKIGDVNGNASTDVTNPTVESRSNNDVNLTIVERTVEAGETVAIPVTAANFNEVFGYQFTMNLNGASFVGVESGAIEMNANNVGVLSNEVVTMSFASNEAVSTKGDDVLFTMIVKANKAGNVSEMMALNSDVTVTESYVGAEMTVGKVSLNVRTADETAAIELFQNEPNPFKGQTSVSFHMPSAAQASLSVYDVTGKLVTVRNIDAVKGYNSEVFTTAQLGTSGVLYYTLVSGEFTATKKMIIVE